MRLARVHRIPAPAERLWARMFDVDFDRRHAIDALSVDDYQLLERVVDGERWLLRTRMRPRLKLPGFVKRWLGDAFSYELRLERAAGSSRATATLTPNLLPEEVRLGFTLDVTPDGDGACLRAMEWEVAIRGFGGLMERFVVAELESGIEASARFAAAELGGAPAVAVERQDEAARPPRVEVEAAEINLTDHCNLRCSGCNHASPHLPPRFASLDDYRRDLAALAPVLHLGELKLVGGEPLLHPELVPFLEMARASGVADLLTLVTNGVLLHRMPDAVWPLIDRLWISVYPGVKLRFDLAEVERLCRLHDVELWKKDTPTFQLTLLNDRITDERLVEHVYRECANAHVWSCHTIHEGRYYKCSPAPFLAPRLGARGVDRPEAAGDSVALRGRTGDPAALADELRAYLASPRPLDACSYCLGSLGPDLPNQQLGKAGLAAELAACHLPVESLLPADSLPRFLRA